MFENPRRGRQETNFTTNVPKILDLKSSSEQIFSENWRWVPLVYPPKSLHNHCVQFLLGITVVPREIEDNGYAKFWNKVVNVALGCKFGGDAMHVYGEFLIESCPTASPVFPFFKTLVNSDSIWTVFRDHVADAIVIDLMILYFWFYNLKRIHFQKKMLKGQGKKVLTHQL